MTLSGEEERQWRQLEGQLAQEPRLVVLAGQLAESSPMAPMTRMAMLLWALGSGIGLLVGVIGFATGDNDMGMAGVTILVVTVVLAGIALMMIGLTSLRPPARS
jgi:hypothetical protein